MIHYDRIKCFKMIKTNEDWYPSYKKTIINENNKSIKQMYFKCSLLWSIDIDKSRCLIVNCRGLDDCMYTYYTTDVIKWLKTYRKIHDYITKKELMKLGFLNE